MSAIMVFENSIALILVFGCRIDSFPTLLWEQWAAFFKVSVTLQAALCFHFSFLMQNRDNSLTVLRTIPMFSFIANWTEQGQRWLALWRENPEPVCFLNLNGVILPIWIWEEISNPDCRISFPGDLFLGRGMSPHLHGAVWGCLFLSLGEMFRTRF